MFWVVVQLDGLVIDVAGQCVSPIFKGQDVEEEEILAVHQIPEVSSLQGHCFDNLRKYHLHVVCFTVDMTVLGT